MNFKTHIAFCYIKIREKNVSIRISFIKRIGIRYKLTYMKLTTRVKNPLNISYYLDNYLNDSKIA